MKHLMIFDIIVMIVLVEFSLLSDWSDVNECLEQTSGCQQVCNNTEGGYVCSCREGYTLNSDNKTCSTG